MNAKEARDLMDAHYVEPDISSIITETDAYIANVAMGKGPDSDERGVAVVLMSPSYAKSAWKAVVRHYRRERFKCRASGTGELRIQWAKEDQ